MSAIAPLFVVGTGRCGSTMLSELLREHEHVLSLSEFFTLTTDLGGRIAEGFSPEPIDAAAFWRIVAGAHPKQTTMLRHDVVMPEVLYRPSSSSRFTAETGVPAILQTVLPHLSADADDLFAEVESFVATLPTAPASGHYARLFGWLARRFGKRTWVERSGGSLRIVQRLTDAFPTARFLHIVRDGRACASSMSKHLGFRMALVAMQLAEILGADPYESSDRTWISDVPDELLDFLPERFDGEAFRAHRVPLPLFGHYWSGEIVQGLRELAAVPADRVLTLRYEDFVAAPRRAIGRVAEFLGSDCADERWVERVATHVRASTATLDDVDARTLRALDDACAPGFAALGDLYAGAA
jgi:hypothetical protein